MSQLLEGLQNTAIKGRRNESKRGRVKVRVEGECLYIALQGR
jgi:hypothetical protein